jgi:DNA-binding response OmpR family regulator
MNILLAEDDERLGKLMTHLLKKEFHLVDWVKNGKEAYSYACLSSYDVILLDWMLPGENGLSVCKRLREKGIQSGILFVTAKDANENIISGLDSGADDYIVKPFEFNELLARIRSISRRKEKPLEGYPRYGPVVLVKHEWRGILLIHVRHHISYRFACLKRKGMFIAVILHLR